MEVEKDALAKEEERLERALQKKKQPVLASKQNKPAPAPTTSVPKTISTQQPEWKKQEELRRKQQAEERVNAPLNKAKEDEQKRIEVLLKQREDDRIQQALREESEFPQSDPDKKEDEAARLKYEEDLLNRRLYRGKAGASSQEIEEHNKKVLELLAAEKIEAQKRAAENEKAEKWERECPKFEIDGQLLLGIIAEVNKVRVSPKIYIKFLESILPNYSGNVYTIHGNKTRNVQEGDAPVKELIEQLKSASRKKMLKHSDGLSLSAYDLIRDHNKKGTVSLLFSDGTLPQERVERYGTITSPYEELLGYEFESAEDLVLQWALADGESSRHSRQIILNEEYTTIGISVGPNSKFKNMCVATFCKDFADN